MADNLEKTISVDLSSLDAKLSLAEKTEKKVEGDVERTEARIKTDEKNAQKLEKFTHKVEHKLKHLQRHLLREGVTLGLEEISGVEPGSAASTGLNIIAAGSSAAAFGAGAAITAVLMTAFRELQSQYKESKQREHDLAIKIEEQKQALKDYQREKKAEAERDQREMDARFEEIEKKAAEATREMLYQTTQYQDQ